MTSLVAILSRPRRAITIDALDVAREGSFSNACTCHEAPCCLSHAQDGLCGSRAYCRKADLCCLYCCALLCEHRIACVVDMPTIEQFVEAMPTKRKLSGGGLHWGGASNARIWRCVDQLL